MSLIMCPLCVRDDDVFLVRALPDGRKQARCDTCAFEFSYGVALPVVTSSNRTLDDVLRQFPKSADVSVGDRERAEALKSEFLRDVLPVPDPKVAPYWSKYQQVFSAEGLPLAAAADLKSFANDSTGVNPGNMSVFNTAWNSLGEDEGARRVRAVTEYLLRGPGAVEERLSTLIRGDHRDSMTGWKEALLTRTLAVVHPERFLTIVTYDQKRAMAATVYGLELPPADRVSWTIGRLVVWSNDLLLGLVGSGFGNQQHAAEFLWWAQNK
jgi:hypothetical protein